MTPAIKLLQELNIDFSLREYDSRNHESNFGLAAASALQQDAHQVFKTLLATLDGNHRKPVVALVAVADQLDLKKLASTASARKATMADPPLAQKATGYVVGGISPLGQRQKLPTYIDESAQLFETIFVSGGKRGLQIEICPATLCKLLQGHFAPIAKLSQ
ncbi:aminoacyl-tRNA deacylase [Chromatiales bacterium (ex Bugula neritina AB1)]|nr:aminoacyl-tRNA deacylase [Chromatiales bacterium (ex Bugula neritina AB1)]